MADTSTGDIHVLVLTPSKKLVDAKAENVYFPTVLGMTGILPGHAALVTQLATGVCHFTHSGVTTFLNVVGGVAEVAHNRVTLLVDVAEEASGIDADRAKKSLERARTRLSGKDKTDVDGERALKAEARALARLEAAQAHQSKK